MDFSSGCSMTSDEASECKAARRRGLTLGVKQANKPQVQFSKLKGMLEIELGIRRVELTEVEEIRSANVVVKVRLYV